MSTARSETPAVDVRRHPRAKRMRLRYDGIADRVILTVPPRMSERRALEWASGQVDWIAWQREKRAAAVPFEPGASLPYCGETLLLVHDPEAPRRIVREPGKLVGGGPLEGFGARIERWLRGEARQLLSDDVTEFAAKAGVRVGAVAVGDARTRWGSCSHDGRLCFSWRLVCAPPDARRYVAAHEVAHRVHMNHGRQFYRLEEKLFGTPTSDARRRLRELGPGLQRIGR